MSGILNALLPFRPLRSMKPHVSGLVMSTVVYSLHYSSSRDSARACINLWPSTQMNETDGNDARMRADVRRVSEADLINLLLLNRKTSGGKA